jgi:hypothetical protein
MIPIMMPAAAVAIATGTVCTAPSRSAAGPSFHDELPHTGAGPFGRMNAWTSAAIASNTHADTAIVFDTQ